MATESREKPHHQHHPDHQTGQHGGGVHTDMLAPLADCQVLLCGGMGAPAYQKALAAGLKVYLVGGDILPALHLFLEGRLVSDLQRVHQH